MPVKIAFVILSLVLVLVAGGKHSSSNQQQNEAMRVGRIRTAIQQAKAQGKRAITLSAPIPFYASVKTLDEGLSNYSTVIAEPTLKYAEIGAESKEIETWYKFQISDFLSEPKDARCGTCYTLANVPVQLQPVQSNEFVVARQSGTVTSEGITVTSQESFFPDFRIGQKYLIFLSLNTSTRVGSIELGPSGVSTVKGTGELVPVSDRHSKLQRDLNARYGKVDQIKNQLKFRRFPE